MEGPPGMSAPPGLRKRAAPEPEAEEEAPQGTFFERQAREPPPEETPPAPAEKPQPAVQEKPLYPPGYTFDRQLYHKDGRRREVKKDHSTRYARVQVAANKKRYQREEGRNEYNVWYGKYLDWDKSHDDRCKAETRCSLKKDAGATKATDKSYFCIWFARGCCTLGKDCLFLHRAPNLEDAKRIDETHDCFGRDRHASMRDDMGGVGCFNQDCRGLYVGNLGTLAGPAKYNPKDRNNASLPGYLNATEILARHFGEWGAIEECSYKPKFACAFIRYVSRLNAEFAKVAMSDQSLDNPSQFINVRWAYEDPNPQAKLRVKDELVGRMRKAVEEKGYAAQEAEIAAQTEADGGFKNKKDFGKNPYAPDYDAFGYHRVTGEYNPSYNINAHELHKDEFAQQAGRAAVAALKRAEKYSRANQLESELAVTDALVTGTAHPELAAAAEGASQEVDWNAYYQYYNYALAAYQSGLQGADTSTATSSSSCPSSSSSSGEAQAADPSSQSAAPTAANPGVAIYNYGAVALIHPTDSLSLSYLEEAHKATQEAEWAANEAALFAASRPSDAGKSSAAIGPSAKGTKQEQDSDPYEEMIRRKEEQARKHAEGMLRFSRLLDEIDQRHLNKA